MSKTTDPREAVVQEVLDTTTFLYSLATEQDELAIRAMVVAGGTADQINRALSISAINERVDTEDKMRYANGVLRNLMIEDASPREDYVLA